MRKSIGLAAVFLFSSLYVGAQTGNSGTIKGFVYDKKTGEPMIYTNVSLGGDKGAQTDVNGYFSIVLAPGTYTLTTTALGFDSSVVTVNLLPNAIVTKKMYIGQRETELKGIQVSGRKTEKMTRINTGVTSVTPRELKLLPSSGGEPDLAQYLQVIPGVVFTGDQGGQLYIRGGSPAQTGIYLDGITIYSPFHSIGLYSVFETEAIRNVDVYTAGFGAQYGNRTSAIVDVHTKDGNKNELSGLVSASPIMGRALLEGPLLKSKKEDGGAITFLVTAKSSYINQTSKSLYGGFGEPFSSGLPYRFTDAYGKITFSSGNGSKLNVFGFNFDDHSSILDDSTHQDMIDYHWKATGAGATFVVSPGSSSALIDGKLAFSNYNIDMTKQLIVNNDSLPRNSQINGFEAAINFTYFLSNYSQIKYGIEVNGTHTLLSYTGVGGVSADEERQSTIAGLFFQYRKNFSSRLIFEPGLRIQYYSELNKFSPEPRVGIKYNITENIRFKAASGIYSQNIISTKSDQDIVNLFTGFILSPDQTIKDVHGNEVKSNLQTAYHGVAGLEIDIKKVEVNIEPWVKYFAQVDEFNRNKLYVNDPDFVAANGLANGIDLSAKYSIQRVYLWGAVGYQNVNYTSIDSKGNEQTYPTPFDTRFNINAVASYTAGKHKDWELSTRYNLHSPFPFTQTQGFYENVNITGGGIGTNYLTANGNTAVIYSDKINGGRLSYYHRLDVSVRKRFELNKKNKLDATVAVTNVYDRQNIFFIDRSTNARTYQLPLFPSMNLTWTF